MCALSYPPWVMATQSSHAASGNVTALKRQLAPGNVFVGSQVSPGNLSSITGRANAPAAAPCAQRSRRQRCPTAAASTRRSRGAAARSYDVEVLKYIVTSLLNRTLQIEIFNGYSNSYLGVRAGRCDLMASATELDPYRASCSATCPSAASLGLFSNSTTAQFLDYGSDSRRAAGAGHTAGAARRRAELCTAAAPAVPCVCSVVSKRQPGNSA